MRLENCECFVTNKWDYFSESEIYLSYDAVSESVIKPCIKDDNPQWIKYANYVVRLCVDLYKNVAFSNGEIVTF